MSIGKALKRIGQINVILGMHLHFCFSLICISLHYYLQTSLGVEIDYVCPCTKPLQTWTLSMQFLQVSEDKNGGSSLSSRAVWGKRACLQGNGVVHCSALLFSTMQCRALQCNAVQYNAVQSIAVHCCSVQCSAEHCSAVLRVQRDGLVVWMQCSVWLPSS